MGVPTVFPERGVCFVPWRLSREGRKVVTARSRVSQAVLWRQKGGIEVSEDWRNLREFKVNGQEGQW